MPGRWAQVAIVVFWLAMTGWLVRRDVLPRLGYGEMDFRSVLTDRAVEEPVHWTLFVNEREVGSSLSSVKPMENGDYALVNRTRLGADLLGEQADSTDGRIILDSEFHVTALGRLRNFAISARAASLGLKVDIEGTVEGDRLQVRTQGLGAFDKELTVPIDPEAVLVDRFGSIDRLPGLRVGKKWTTRTVNPLSSLFSGSALLGFGGPSIDVVSHEVVGTEVAPWNGRTWPCHVVESRYDRVVAKTWANARDGRVLRQEVPIAGVKVRMELVPPTDTDSYRDDDEATATIDRTDATNRTEVP